MSLTFRNASPAEHTRMLRIIKKLVWHMNPIIKPTGPGYRLSFWNAASAEQAHVLLAADARLVAWTSIESNRDLCTRFTDAPSKRRHGAATPPPPPTIESRLDAIEKRLDWLERACPISGP